MIAIYCLLFAKDDDRFVSAHHARSNDHAYGFMHGVKSASTKHRVYMFPRDHDLAVKQETPEQLHKAKLAISIDKSRRAKDAHNG